MYVGHFSEFFLYTHYKLDGTVKGPELVERPFQIGQGSNTPEVVVPAQARVETAETQYMKGAV